MYDIKKIQMLWGQWKH